MHVSKRIAHHTLAIVLLMHLPIQSVSAACNATVNNRPMTHEECATAIRVYGSVIPGHYYVDKQGNWVNANNPAHRGNTYIDGRKASSGAWGGGSHFSPRGIYDASGGCEGGSCVNVID